MLQHLALASISAWAVGGLVLAARAVAPSPPVAVLPIARDGGPRE